MVARYPMGPSFSLKTISAKRTVHIVSEFDRIAVSYAVVCSRPVKNKAGASMAPVADIASTRGQSLAFICSPFTLYDNGAEESAASKYTSEPYISGLVVARTGLEAVDIDPTSMAHSTADT